MAEIERRPKANRRVIGPYSSAGAMSLIDGRTRQALFMQRLRKKLLDHVGGDPTITQRQLIERVVRLSMLVEIFDAKFFKDGELSERDQRQHITYSNALSRTLAKLGVNAKSPAKVSRPSRVMVEDDIVLSFSSNATPSEPRPRGKAKARSSDFDPSVGLGASYTEQYFRDRDRKKNKARRPSPKSAEAGSFQTTVVSR